MTDAGREAVLPEGPLQVEVAPEVLATVDAYLEQAGGDARIALVHAVVDGFAVAGLVSRGFALWGQPQRRARFG